MHARKVRWTAAAFALALFALAGAVAWSAKVRTGASPSASTSDAPESSRELDGRAMYVLHCERCHAVEELAETCQGPDAGVRVLELIDFLAEHGDAGSAEDRAIARYLATLER